MPCTVTKQTGFDPGENRRFNATIRTRSAKGRLGARCCGRSRARCNRRRYRGKCRKGAAIGAAGRRKPPGVMRRND